MLKYQSFMKVSDEDNELKIWNYTGDLKDDGNKYRGCITDKTNEVICPSLEKTFRLAMVLFHRRDNASSVPL